MDLLILFLKALFVIIVAVCGDAHMPLILALRRQRLLLSEPSSVYRAGSRTARVPKRNPVSKTKHKLTIVFYECGYFD